MRRRIAAAAVIAVGAVLALAGCTFFAPQATSIHYDPSDGVGITVGSVDVRNAFVVSSNGEVGNFVGAVINNDNTSKIVTIKYLSHTGGTSSYVTLPEIVLTPNETALYGEPGVAQLQLNGMNSKPGTLIKLIVSYGGTHTKSAVVPVLDGPLSAYQKLLPTPTPTPSDIPSVTPTPTATAQPN